MKLAIISKGGAATHNQDWDHESADIGTSSDQTVFRQEILESHQSCDTKGGDDDGQKVLGVADQARDWVSACEVSRGVIRSRAAGLVGRDARLSLHGHVHFCGYCYRL